MCKWGQWENVEVTVPADLSHTGRSYRKTANIDRCIASTVRALDARGVIMRGSCCGHGKQPGQIVLSDGSILPV